jgi:predicted RND superfamily exporter protein
MSRFDETTDRLNYWIVDHPGKVIVVFLVLTAGFAVGLDNVTMSSGMSQFSEDVDAYGTNEYVEEQFQQPFEEDEETTLLLQSHENVLSQSGMLELLRIQQSVEDREDLRVVSVRSPATLVALELDPTARKTEDQIRVIEGTTDAEIRRATRRAADDPGFRDLIGEDFNREAASSSAAIGVIEHDTSGDDELFESVQLEIQHIADSTGSDVRVFGSGISDHENRAVLTDSMSASIPAVIVLLLLFLAVAYRDPFDLALGVVSLGMALIWTFGFLGHAGIPFSQLQVALPPLLLAIGVDFGIHIINRYREEFRGDRTRAMRRATAPLFVAFLMVMATSVIGFSANMASGLTPITDFGLTAAIGIVSVTLIFSVFLPAGKVFVEGLRERTALPLFHARPLGAEDSALGRLLPVHLRVTSKLPVVFLVVVLLTAGAAGYYGQEVDSSFEDEDMLPPEELPSHLSLLPEQMEPGTYTVTGSIHFIEEEFESTPEDTVTVYVQGPMDSDYALESVARAGEDPPDSFVSENREATATSIITVIDDYAAESESFASLVDRSDRNGNGVPDTNVDEVYDTLMSSPYEQRALRYIDEDYRETRVVYAVEGDATDKAVTADAGTVADAHRFDAVETGEVVVFQRVSEEVFQSAVTSLGIALVLATLLLVVLYHLLEGRAVLGLITPSPIVVTVLFLVATMRYLEIPFNTLTATILSISVGIGIDYSIHIVHRFVEEYEAHGDELAAARTTLQGTGGALFGTTITTVSAGAALHYLSITPILVQFGLLIAFSVTYSFVASVLFLPVVLIVWAKGDLLRDQVAAHV